MLSLGFFCLFFAMRFFEASGSGPPPSGPCFLGRSLHLPCALPHVPHPECQKVQAELQRTEAAASLQEAQRELEAAQRQRMELLRQRELVHRSARTPAGQAGVVRGCVRRGWGGVKVGQRFSMGAHRQCHHPPPPPFLVLRPFLPGLFPKVQSLCSHHWCDKGSKSGMHYIKYCANISA